jgi:hypothetical protein
MWSFSKSIFFPTKEKKTENVKRAACLLVRSSSKEKRTFLLSSLSLFPLSSLLSLSYQSKNPIK